ncbi:unnamed protein product [Linum tenue]|uniref:beta-glucosidase n=1 Tax=Linum tenue TaxID=586396 RepID=A0AAV0HIS4_9ROSI|nr:unnamed protein product [Linum tenue]
MARRSYLFFLAGLVILWPALAAADYIKYRDPKQPTNARITDLMNRMTLQEKIGQMVQIERTVASPQVMKNYFIGSVLSGGGSSPGVNASAQEWIKMVNQFQRDALSTRLGIPMIYGIDSVHGHSTVYNATIFPHNIGLGATRDPELVKRIGAATALEARATGIPYLFAPCVAVCRDPRWGRCYESYSEDPEVVSSMTEIVTGLQGDIPSTSPKGVPYVGGKTKVAACAKHYVGDGGTVNGINENNTILSRHGLLSIHMPGYSASIIKGVSTVMVSYSSWNGDKMHGNRDLITGFLKGTLRFRGFVITDWEGLDRMTSPRHANYSNSILRGINAGIDMIMVPMKYKEFIDDLNQLVTNHEIPMSRIDDAVRLPLPKKGSKILVAGAHADNLGYQCGGWTIQWQGQSGNNATVGTTIMDAIMNTVDKQSSQVVYQENPDTKYLQSEGFSYAIVVVGELPYAETEGNNMNLTIPEPGPTMIKNVCRAVKCVVVVVSGRPVVIEPYLKWIDGLVAAWLPGTEGQGVADVLFGNYGFSGKLSRTWFRSVDQLPMNVGDEHYDPLFPFGFGLTTEPTDDSN